VKTHAPFVADIGAIRERARRRMLDGARAATYGLDRNAAVEVLNEALATEIVSVQRYKRHAFTAAGSLFAHAAEGAAQADRIAARIVQLGGTPDFSPDFPTSRGHSEYVEGEGLREMIEEDLVAERIAIDTYREMVRWFGGSDPTTRRMLEEIVAKEEEHAGELSKLLRSCNRRGKGP